MSTSSIWSASGFPQATDKFDITTNSILPQGISAPTPAQGEVRFPKIDGYDLLAVIGRGGTGIVYEARHRELNRRVAIKTLRGDALTRAEYRARLRAEAEAIARLQHPNIIQVFEIGAFEPTFFEDRPAQYIALEYVDGGSLIGLTKAPQPPREAARIVEDLARAVSAAHRLGIVHRDLKPANVLMTRAGVPKIADFGIAKQLDPEVADGNRGITGDGRILGTPEYMAPEVFQHGNATPAVDIYALGVLLYELLTARLPYRGSTSADTLVLARGQDPVAPRRFQPDIPRDLETICLKCLEKSPDRRYRSAGELADDLARWSIGQPVRARAIGFTGRAVRWSRRNPAVALLSAALVLIAVTGLTGVLAGWSRARENAATAEQAAVEARRAAAAADAAARNERWERYRVNIFAASAALRLHDTGAARRALDDATGQYRDWVSELLRSQLDRSRAVMRCGGGDSSVREFTPDGRWATVQDRTGAFRFCDLVSRKEFELPGLGADCHTPAISPDGAVLAVASRADFAVRLYDRAGGTVRKVLRGHTGEVHDVRFSADGTRVATASVDGTLCVWDTLSGQRHRLFRVPPEAGSPLVISPDERFVAARGLETTDSAYLWDLETGRKVLTFGGHHGCVHLVRFSPRGDYLVTAERFPHNAVYLWDVATGRMVARLQYHENQVSEAQFSADGKKLVTSSMDRTVCVWDLSAIPLGGDVPNPLLLRGHVGVVNHAAFSPDGKRVVSSSDDRTIRYWNAETGEPIAVLCGHTGNVIRTVFQPDLATLVSAGLDGTIRFWDIPSVENGYALRGHAKFVYGVAFYPDGRSIASAAWDGTARVWDPTTGELLLRLDHGDDRYVTSVAVDSTGQYLASLARREGGREMSVRLWDAKDGTLLHRWGMPSNWQDGRLAFAPGSDLLAVGGVDGRVRLWRAGSRAEVGVLDAGTSPIRDVAFSPDGRWLAVGCDDGDCSIRIWEVGSWKLQKELKGHTQGVYALAWSRSGRLLASGSSDRTARVWETTDWTSLGELRNGARVYGVAFTADEELLACGCADNLIRFWDVRSCRELAELSGHNDYVHQLAFSPDGSRMVSASGDQTLRVWDTMTNAERARR